MSWSKHLLAVTGAAIAGLAAAAAAAAVPGYHGGGDRSGLYVVSGLDAGTAATAHVDTGFDGHVPGQIYAQPLYWRASGAAHGILIVATELNIVAGIDASTGAEIWERSLGHQVPVSHLPCGNISPVGITGTPVLDPSSGVVYVVTLEQGSAGPQHVIHAVSATDGSEMSGWPVNIPAALRAKGISFTSRIENERGALDLFKGVVYVPFGGNSGDCRDYHGVVVGFDAGTGALAGAWITRAAKGGAWSVGGVVDDGTSLFAATGNTAGTQTWGDGESVFRLPRDLAHSTDTHDYFSPTNWLALDRADEDLGSTAPLPIDLPQGSGSQPVILQMGKDGNVYVLDRGNLGGIANAPASLHLLDGRLTTGPARFPVSGGMGAAVVGYGVDCNGASGNSLIAISLSAGSPPSIARLWCQSFSGRGTPIVTTTDGTANPIVWVVGALGDELLHGYDANTGTPVFTGGTKPTDTLNNPAPFITPVPAEGRLYVAENHRIRAFVFTRR